VLAGVRSAKGMASFADKLKPEDTAVLRSYLIAQANELKKRQPPTPPPAPVQPADAHAGLGADNKK